MNLHYGNRMVAVVAMFTMIGCGSGQHQVVKQVTGQVFLDGEPAQRLGLRFWHTDRVQSPFGGSTTDQDGFYDIRPCGESEKWPTGTYIVEVLDNPHAAAFRTRPQPPPAIIYCDRRTSPLRMEIGKGDNELPCLYLESAQDPSSPKPGLGALNSYFLPINRVDFGTK